MSYRNVQSRNRTRNQVLDIASFRTRIGTGFQDWKVSEPEAESKKLEPGISDLYYYDVDLLSTREIPGNNRVNISNWQTFMGNGNAFNYSEILK